MTAPSPKQIQEAGRRLQRGGLLGTGSSKRADEVIAQAEEVGLDPQAVAMQILGAAADHKPRPWAR